MGILLILFVFVSFWGICSAIPGAANILRVGPSSQLLQTLSGMASTDVDTLNQLGNICFNLEADTTDKKYADGSLIEGQTNNTKSDGSKGLMAATSLAFDAEAYAVKTTSVKDGYGPLTVTNTATKGYGRTAVDTVRQKGSLNLFELRARRTTLRRARLADGNGRENLMGEAANDDPTTNRISGCQLNTVS